MIVNLPLNTTVSGLMTLVFTNKGATVKVLDKAGFARTIGFLNVDDVVEVTALDGVTKVMYKIKSDLINSVIDLRANSEFSVSVYPIFILGYLLLVAAPLRSIWAWI